MDSSLRNQEVEESAELSVPLNPINDTTSQKDTKVVDGEKDGENIEEKESETGRRSKRLVYGVDERPPFHIALVCALQVKNLFCLQGVHVNHTFCDLTVRKFGKKLKLY